MADSEKERMQTQAASMWWTGWTVSQTAPFSATASSASSTASSMSSKEWGATSAEKSSIRSLTARSSGNVVKHDIRKSHVTEIDEGPRGVLLHGGDDIE